MMVPWKEGRRLGGMDGECLPTGPTDRSPGSRPRREEAASVLREDPADPHFCGCSFLSSLPLPLPSLLLSLLLLCLAQVRGFLQRH